MLNTILTIWASHRFPIASGLGTLISGDCTRSKSWALWLHMAINVLSTILLGASNYTMQCLMAPTREEVNRAHAENSWLTIGIPGIRNFQAIRRRRLVLFTLLALSSVPLHLV